VILNYEYSSQTSHIQPTAQSQLRLKRRLLHVSPPGHFSTRLFPTVFFPDMRNSTRACKTFQSLTDHSEDYCRNYGRNLVKYIAMLNYLKGGKDRSSCCNHTGVESAHSPFPLKCSFAAAFRSVCVCVRQLRLLAEWPTETITLIMPRQHEWSWMLELCMILGSARTCVDYNAFVGSLKYIGLVPLIMYMSGKSPAWKSSRRKTLTKLN